MPTYNFRNKETGEETSEFMSISALDQYLLDNPHLEQGLSGTPMIGYSYNSAKPDQYWKDRLREIKKSHYKSNIDV